MTPRERTTYSAIVDRPPLRLPDGARVVVWSIVNLEVWDISRPMARQILAPPTGQTLLPDVPNWSWHEYGMRVGVWRFFDLYKRLGIRPTLSVNARVCEDYERVATEAGVKYIGDWVYDDEPTEISTQHGPLVTLPYTVELNDIPTMIVQHHESPYWFQRCRDSFDRLHAEGAGRAKIMAIAIHPYISGQPHRIAYLEQVYDYVNRHEGVLHWNGAEILDWYLAEQQRPENIS